MSSISMDCEIQNNNTEGQVLKSTTSYKKKKPSSLTLSFQVEPISSSLARAASIEKELRDIASEFCNKATLHKTAQKILHLPVKELMCNDRWQEKLERMLSEAKEAGLSQSRDFAIINLGQRSALGEEVIQSTEEEIGAGGFGSVTKAYVADVACAAKYIKPIHKNSLERETKALHDLEHPHVIQMIFRRENTIYLELADTTVKKWIETHKDSHLISHVFKQVADGLSYVHEQGYFHGDIKLDNLLLVHDVVKIADFGTAIKYEDFGKENEAPITSIYASPEYHGSRIASGSIDVQKVDVWAFGLMIWSLLKQDAIQTPYVAEDNVHGKYGEEELPFIAGITQPGDPSWNIAAQIDEEKAQEIDPKGILTKTMLACLNLDPNERPTMAMVKEMLSE